MFCKFVVDYICMVLWKILEIELLLLLKFSVVGLFRFGGRVFG